MSVNVGDGAGTASTATTAPATEERAAYIERARMRGIPTRFTDITLKGEQTPAIVQVRAFLNGTAQQGGALVLLGPPGIGKTAAGCAAVMAWPRPAWFLSADAIAQAAARDHDDLHAISERAQRSSLLVLDDVGRMKQGGLGEQVVEEILSHRHAEMLPTIVSSNWTPVELRQRLSPRLLDRLREWATILAVAGPSRRVRSA